MMKTLTNFGIVLVVLAMVTSSVFATNVYKGPDCGTWFDADNWSDNVIPYDGGTTQIRDGDCVIIDLATSAEADELDLRDGSLQVGSTIANGDANEVRANLTMNELTSAANATSDNFLLNIVNADVVVDQESRDVAEDGTFQMDIAAGSSLTFNGRVRVADSGDAIVTLNIDGTITTNQRIEFYRSETTINLTGDGVWQQNHSARFSNDEEGITTINISGTANYEQENEIRVGHEESSDRDQVDLAINISGDGEWDGNNENVVWKNDGKRIDISVTGNGSFIVRDINPDVRDDAELHITVDGAGARAIISGDLGVGFGTISIINGGELDVNHMLLGIGGDSYMTAATTDGAVSIDGLTMGDAGNDSQLTIDGMRVDIEDWIEFGTTDGDQWIDILGDGELVIAGADDQAEWDIYDGLIIAGLIRTSEEGMVVVWDYGITHSDKFTMRIVIPVDIDIQPGGCPNPLRVNFIGQGVFPVAILGSEDFDVLDVDVATITLQGVSPVRSNEKDISTIGAEACECTTLGPDDFLDLELKFKRADILTALEESLGDLSEIKHKTDIPLTLSAMLMGTDVAIEGTDCLRILNRGRIKREK